MTNDEQSGQPIPLEIDVSEHSFGVFVRVRFKGRWVKLGPAATAAIRQVQRERSELPVALRAKCPPGDHA